MVERGGSRRDSLSDPDPGRPRNGRKETVFTVGVTVEDVPGLRGGERRLKLL